MNQPDVTEDGNVSSPDSSAPPSPVLISGSMRRDTAISKEKAKFFRQSAAFNARGVNGRGSGVPKVNAHLNKRLSSSSSDSSGSSSSSSSSHSRSSSSSSTSSSSSDSSNSSSSSSSSSTRACSLSVRPSRPIFPLPKCLAARSADVTKSCSPTSESNYEKNSKTRVKSKCSDKITNNEKKCDESKTAPKVLLRAPKLIARVSSSQPKIFPLLHSKSDNSNYPISLFKKLLTDTSNEPWGFAVLAAKAASIENTKTELVNNKKDKPIAGFFQLKGLFDGLSHFYSTPLQSRTRPRSEKDLKSCNKTDPKVTCEDTNFEVSDKQPSPSFLIKSAVSSKMMETREISKPGGKQMLEDQNISLKSSPSAFRDRLSGPTIRPVTRSGKQVPYKFLLVLASCIKHYHNS